MVIRLDDYCYTCGHTARYHQKVPGGVVIDCRMVLEDITRNIKFRIIGICACKKFITKEEAMNYNWLGTIVTKK